MTIRTALRNDEWLNIPSNINVEHIFLGDCYGVILHRRNENDDSDTSILTKSVTDLSKILKNNSIIIISSQSPIGFCSTLRTIIKNLCGLINTE